MSEPKKSDPPSGRLSSDFRLYEICLFVCTQLGYVPVVASMLATNFFSQTKAYCAGNATLENEFKSLPLEWNLACKHVFLLYTASQIFSTLVMLGGLMGAFIAGYMADRYGRKPACVDVIETYFPVGLLCYNRSCDKCSYID
ncbi:hypothetical protein AB6A40_004362 [Gnathostoma spinigerum]|uniref:Major facilitator superfamily (MFS) profile domain-containing protein n=1 Tax=Gnathostoma spinigerum TaxID=75299 RepID=A0ABD6EL14_9BILA